MYKEEKDIAGVTGKVPIADILPSKFVSAFASSITVHVDDMILGPCMRKKQNDLHRNSLSF